ncbi:MAG TPA: MarR family winged helix-turn-helix transcriptional regulator [Trebonia sp.]
MQQDEMAADQAAQVALDLQTSCLGVRIGRLNRLVGRRFDHALRPLGLSIAQMEVLGALMLNESPPRPADLAQWLAVERSTMSRNLALMEKHGYVRTTETSPTGRSQRVTITREGQIALGRAEQAWRQAQDSIIGQLGGHSVATLDSWLESLARAQPGR